MLSLNSALQLTDIQRVASFSDSSDGKNRKNFSYVYYVNGEPSLVQTSHLFKEVRTVTLGVTLVAIVAFLMGIYAHIHQKQVFKR